nr:hypothetical protein [Tanacetum cinerariifolium]
MGGGSGGGVGGGGVVGLKCETNDGDEISERSEDGLGWDIEGKLCFIKMTMSSNIKTLGRDIKTMISMMGGAVAKKDIQRGTEINFVTIVQTKMVPHASNTNVVDGKWVYRLKRDKNGAITYYKARFVAKCFRQQLGNNKCTINNIIFQLVFVFALKDLEPLNDFLSIEIVPHVSGILLSQKKYILELLQSVGLSNCNPVSSPMITSSSLSLDDSAAFFNLVKYRQLVCSLQYVTLSRPDIAFAVYKVCQYMHALTENHWSPVKRILHYLHGTVEHGMLIRRSFGSTLQAFTDVLWKGNPDSTLEAFSDTDWAGNLDDRRSTGGKLNKRLTWLHALLNELGIHSSSTPIL